MLRKVSSDTDYSAVGRVVTEVETSQLRTCAPYLLAPACTKVLVSPGSDRAPRWLPVARTPRRRRRGLCAVLERQRGAPCRKQLSSRRLQNRCPIACGVAKGFPTALPTQSPRSGSSKPRDAEHVSAGSDSGSWLMETVTSDEKEGPDSRLRTFRKLTLVFAYTLSARHGSVDQADPRLKGSELC